MRSPVTAPTANPAEPVKTPTSTAGSNRLSAPFTLVELVVAIAIVALASGLAVATLRGESPAQLLERTALEFGAFCARVRYRAAEEAVDWVVVFDPDQREFYATTAEAAARAGTPDAEAPDETPAAPRLNFRLDERISFETPDNAEGQLAVGEILTLFRFFPDGGAGGGHTLSLKYGALERNFSLSKLTGRLLVSTGEEEER